MKKTIAKRILPSLLAVLMAFGGAVFAAAVSPLSPSQWWDVAKQFYYGDTFDTPEKEAFAMAMGAISYAKSGKEDIFYFLMQGDGFEFACDFVGMDLHEFSGGFDIVYTSVINAVFDGEVEYNWWEGLINREFKEGIFELLEAGGLFDYLYQIADQAVNEYLSSVLTEKKLELVERLGDKFKYLNYFEYYYMKALLIKNGGDEELTEAQFNEFKEKYNEVFFELTGSEFLSLDDVKNFEDVEAVLDLWLLCYQEADPDFFKEPENPNVCEIGGVGYLTLKDALEAVPNNTPTTITFLKDVFFDAPPEGSSYSETICKNKNITFENEGYDFTIEGLRLFDSSIITINGDITLVADEIYGEAALGIREYGTLTINGDIYAPAYAYESYGGIIGVVSDIIINGNIVESSIGIYTNQSNVTVTGDINSAYLAVYSQMADNTIMIGGNITSGGIGIIALGAGDITVGGDITVTGENDIPGLFGNYRGTGVMLSFPEFPGFTSCINTTVDGTVSSDKFIVINENFYAVGDKEAVSSKPGYDEYTDGNSYFWGKGWIYKPLPYICEINGTGYLALEEALAAVPDNTLTTITFLKDVYLKTKTEILEYENKEIIFETNGYGFTVENKFVFYYSEITINGNVSMPNGYIMGMSSDITINGSIVESLGGLVLGNSNLVVNGDINSKCFAVYDDWGGNNVAVNGKITVTPTLESFEMMGMFIVGVGLADESIATVTGDITVVWTTEFIEFIEYYDYDLIDTGAIGVFVKNGAKVTVDGKIAVEPYMINIDHNAYTADDKASVSSKPGYDEYSNGISFVWVKNDDIISYTVTFNIDSEVVNIEITSGEKAVKPADPEKEGFTFNGWRVGGENGELFDFSTPITENIELFASWTQNPDGPGNRFADFWARLTAFFQMIIDFFANMFNF
ncbi:MAG: InlB B-repeat-containing protein [Oscillospiraceae bacterium]|nr:InlB B-repeat-containing protein [Oscillospiraceae bacterium]